MTRRKLFWLAPLAAVGVALAGDPAAHAQARRVTPERTLLGISLGRDQLEVIRRFGRPSKVQTVALSTPSEQLPGLGGGGGMAGEGGSFGAPGMGMGPGMPGGGGGYPGMGMSPGGSFGAPGVGAPGFGAPGGGSPYGGGSPGGSFGAPPLGAAPGMAGGGGGVPSLAPGNEGSFGAGMPGMPGSPGGAGGANIPEYSTAILWIYERPNDVRLEFLINEDGRVAQISAAAPAGRQYPGAQTARGVRLGSDFVRVMESYGNPERHRLLPGLRFYETYYTKNYHAAFTFDTNPRDPARDGMKVVRITIALAD